MKDIDRCVTGLGHFQQRGFCMEVGLLRCRPEHHNTKASAESTACQTGEM
jgi:hypothetical protein